jgi:hypothetical protein
MKNKFGISLTSAGINISAFSEAEDGASVISSDIIPFGFDFSYDILFSEENLIKLSASLDRYRDRSGIAQMQINFSIPLNYAHIKRIAVMPGFDAKLLQAQVNWELEHYLPETIGNYKVIKSDQEYDFGSYKEIVVVCIMRSLLEKVKTISSQANMVLNKVLIDHFSIENYLKRFKLINSNKNQIVLRIDPFNVITYLFLKGIYYTHYFDLTDISNSSISRNDKILELVKDRINQIEIMVEQLPFINDKESELIILGEGLTPGVDKLLTQNLTQRVIPLADSARDSRGSVVESIGAAIV